MSESSPRPMLLLTIGLGVVSCLLASTSFTVAVPALMAQFHVEQAQVQWTVTGFMAAMTVGMLPTAWLLERFGIRRVFVAAIAVMATAGVAGFFVGHFWLLVGLRVVQGATAGILQPLGTIAIMSLIPMEQRGRATGMLGFGIVLAPALAPSLAGLLLDRFGWHAILLLNLPTCLIAAPLALRYLPGPQPREKRGFDWLGLILLTLFSLSIVEGVAALQHQGLTAPWTLGFFGVAVGALLGFVVHALWARHPILSLSAFVDRNFTLGTLVTFSYGFGLYASTYLVPVFLQQALHFSAAAAGTALMPSGIALACTIPVAGRLADRLSPVRVTMTGLALFCFSFVYFAAVADHIGYAGIVGATIVGRIGLGLVLPSLSISTLRQLPRERIGHASVMNAYVRQIGGVMGVAVAAVFVAWRQVAHGAAADALFRAYAEGFALVAAIYLLALLAAAFMRSRTRA